jgi:hypothetical protein
MVDIAEDEVVDKIEDTGERQKGQRQVDEKRVTPEHFAPCR